MREQSTAIGNAPALFGTWTHPAKPAGVTVIMANTGLHSSMGPRRLQVELARELAGAGVTTLRFDTNGLGESERRNDLADEATLHTRDWQAAVEHVHAQTPTTRIVLFGLCSSALQVFDAASADSRIAGVIMIDGIAHVPAWLRIIGKLRKLVTPIHWQRWRWRKEMNRRRAELQTGVDAYHTTYPNARDTSRRMQALLDRGMHLLTIFTGTYVNSYVVPGQFKLVYRLRAARGRLTERFHGEVDHVYSLPDARRSLARELTDWLAAFPVRS